MATPIIANGFRTQSFWTAGPNGTPWSVIMDFVGDVDPVPEELGSLLVGAGVVKAWTDVFDTEVINTNKVADYIHEDVNLSKVIVQRLDGVEAHVEVVPTFGEVAGTGTDPMPAMISIVVSKRTKLRGPSRRGRLYLSGIATSALSGTGRINATLASKLAFAFEQEFMYLDDAIGDPIGPMVVVGNPDGSGYIDTPVINMTCDTQWDTQKRRVA